MVTPKNNYITLPEINAHGGILYTLHQGLNTDRSAKPTPAKPDNITKEYADKLAYWGQEANNYPDKIIELAYKNSIIPATLDFKARSITAGHLFYTDVETDQDGDPITAYTKHPQIESFIKANKLKTRYLYQIANDFYWFNNAFAEIILSPDRRTISRIRPLKAAFCRLEKAKQNGEIKHLYYSANWETHPPLSSDFVTKIKLLSDFDPISEIKTDTSLKYAIRVGNYMPNTTYYAPCPWHSIFKSNWAEIAMQIAKYKLAILSNGMSVKYHVEIFAEYWTNRFPDWEDAPEKRSDYKRQVQTEFNELLQGTENAGKNIFSGRFIDKFTNKEQSLVKITPIANPLKDGEFLADNGEASSHILYALDLDPTLKGHTPGAGMGAGAGSDKREAFNMFLTLTSVHQNIILEPLNLCLEYNGFTDYEFKIKNPTLQTLNQVPPQNREVKNDFE